MQQYPEFKTERFLRGTQASCLQDTPTLIGFFVFPRSSEFPLGRHRRLAGSQEDPLLCALNSARRPGQRGFPAWILNPVWQLAFNFLFTCCINFVAIFASEVHYAISDDVTKLKSLVCFKYVEGFALGCFTLRKIQKLPQRQETNPEPTQCDLPSCQQGGAGA